MKQWVIFFLFISVIVSMQAETIQLLSFDELMNALKKGEIVRVVAHYGKCQLISGNEIQERVPDALGGMSIEVFEYFAKGSIRNEKAFVVFSQSSLINYGGYIYNYAKFKVWEDGKVMITAQYADPNTFELQMDENFFGEINNGKNEGAIYFYRIK
jgi:hypothetical protein